MRIIKIMSLACIFCLLFVAPALAYNYEFDSGPNSADIFGKPTSNDDPVSPNPMTENIRRNKDAAHLPPPYFYGSGDIPTDQSSPYHDNRRGEAVDSYVEPTYGYDLQGDSTSTMNSYSPGASTSIIIKDAVESEPKYYSNGTIGTLYVERTDKTINVYEGEDLANLKKGAGHFASTSAWDGNVALAGHNRGNYPYFNFIKNTKIGDILTYTTKYGTRDYEVVLKTQIDEYDYSYLRWSEDNILTLITCIEDEPDYRWVVVAEEVL